MTDAEHADLSRRLALAIGWPDDRLSVGRKGVQVWFLHADVTPKRLRPFDYRDPLVIWPIAERYNTFPVKLPEGGWLSWHPLSAKGVMADTAAEAVARAVIGAQQ